MGLIATHGARATLGEHAMHHGGDTFDQRKRHSSSTGGQVGDWLKRIVRWMAFSPLARSGAQRSSCRNVTPSHGDLPLVRMRSSGCV